MPSTDFRWHVGNRQPAGTSDTSRFATDHINNPNAINSIFNLEFRPTQIEEMADGSKVPVHHILKDGADSIGIAGASLRVFVNIGMCSDYWITLHDPVNGRTRQKPFDMAYARANCADWRATEARMANAEAFLKTMKPLHLRDAPGGAAAITTDAAMLQRGKIAFADKCAQCHSSKQPPAEVAVRPGPRHGVVSRVRARRRLSRTKLPVRRSPLPRLAARHEHRARRGDQRDRR